MVRSLSEISSDLLASYDRLSARAECMEQELCIANRELENKVAEVEAILDTLPVGVVVRDADGNVVRVNNALTRMLDCDAKDLLSETQVKDLPQHSSDGASIHWERSDGSSLVLSSQQREITTEDKAHTGSIEVFDDRTELVSLTERLHQMDKMAALGNMAAGIAHEIRNPMNAVKGFADLFKRQLEPDTKSYHWATMISNGVSEVDSIITSLLSFSQPEQLQVESFEASELLEGALAAALQRTPGDRPESAWKITTECKAGSFRGDRIKLRQALRNLISNALDIQPEGGAVSVKLSETENDIICQVSDAGPGITEELASRMTDPFFTTRAEGTGLGLSLVHTIVRLHGGSLELNHPPSELGGALISFHVPKIPLH
ncbi:MAG: two-component system sensor histidine kinase HydH [Planctomycetota bacterium]|jgi:two-component system sensor histidine kinase HydH